MKDMTRLWMGGLMLGAVSLFHIGLAFGDPTGPPFLLRAIAFGVMSIAAFLGDIAQRHSAR